MGGWSDPKWSKISITLQQEILNLGSKEAVARFNTKNTMLYFSLCSREVQVPFVCELCMTKELQKFSSLAVIQNRTYFSQVLEIAFVNLTGQRAASETRP